MMMAPTGTLSAPPAYLEEPTPDNIIVLHGTVQDFAFFLDNFLKVLLKTCITFGWKPGTYSRAT